MAGENNINSNSYVDIYIAENQKIDADGFVIEDGEKLVGYYGASEKPVIPEGITQIAMYVFSDKKITEVTVPQSIKYIDIGAFGHCSCLERVKTAEGTQAVTKGGRGGDAVVLPKDCFVERDVFEESLLLYDDEGFLILGNELHGYCGTAEELIIPSGIIAVRGAAFYGNQTLRRVVLPESLLVLETSAFGVCSCLEQVCMPAGVHTIGNHAFQCCENLTYVSMPTELKTIGIGAFKGCLKLSEVRLPYGLQEIGKDAFSYCRSLREIRIPDSVEKLGENAFMRCEELQEAVLPDRITVIPPLLFAHCTKLTGVEMSEDTSSIGYAAFAGCTSLERIQIPEKAECEEAAFVHCDRLADADGMLIINHHFYGCCIPHKTLRVPNSVRVLDREAFWDRFPQKSDEQSAGEPAVLADTSGRTDISQESDGSSESEKTDSSVYEQRLLKLILPDCIESVTGDYDEGSVMTGYAELSVGDIISKHPCLFWGNKFLRVELSEKTTAIADGVFIDNDMKEITIPSGVQSIGSEAFMSCRFLRRIVFRGSAPVIGFDAFAEVEAYVYFPADDDTWCPAVRQDYGGELIWVAYRDEAEIPEVEWLG